MAISDGWADTAADVKKASKVFDLPRYKETATVVMKALEKGLVVGNTAGFEPPTHPDAKTDNINLIRAAVTHIGHLGFPAYHAYYEQMPLTAQGKPLNGSEPFVLTMPHKQAVKEFWSITRYNTATRLPIDPARIGGNNRQVFAEGNTKPDKNGNVTITFSAKDPKNGTYWMPVIDGEQYYFIARYYGPLADLAGKTAQSIIYKGTPLENIIIPKKSFN